jgi:alpha/beta superfamily hydrolase
MTDEIESHTTSKVEKITFSSGDIQLEGMLHLVHAPKQPGIIFCHPHPLFGGSMDDERGRVITEVAGKRGFNVLRFNYRGVGGSQGTFGNGIGEVQDTVAAIEFLRQHPHVDSSRIVLIGYSFGGSIAIAAAFHTSPTALVTMSAPIRLDEVDPTLVTEALRYVSCPTYILHGSDDTTVPSAEAEAIHVQLETRKKFLRIIKGADHFYHRYLDEVVQRIFAFLAENIGTENRI